jgi:caffeoyl-CoA O-methyltransferase|tara:strand:+ start:845 stop:1003 length:159 start_codon:yes stop_codon:yes gene_type:complete
MFWNGRVLNEQDQEKSTKSIRALNEKLKKDPRINLSIIPIDDGLKLVQKVGG